DGTIIVGWAGPRAEWALDQIKKASSTVFLMDRTTRNSDPRNLDAPPWVFADDLGVNDLRPHPSESSNMLFWDGHVSLIQTKMLTEDEKDQLFDHYGDGY